MAALDAATTSRDRVAALTQTIRAYEEGLATLREALRQAELREATLTLSFNAKRDRIGQLLGVLARMEADPGPLLLLHPDGPLGTARSGMILAEVTPALQAEADQLKAELQELADLRALQLSAGKTLTDGLATAQAARSALSQAISDRTDLPKRFTEDPDDAARPAGMRRHAGGLCRGSGAVRAEDGGGPDLCLGQGQPAPARPGHPAAPPRRGRRRRRPPPRPDVWPPAPAHWSRPPGPPPSATSARCWTTEM